MKLHSDILTEQDIRDCVPAGCYLAGHYAKDGVTWASIHVEGSRSRARGFTVRLSGSHKSTMQSLPDKAATWDEWGIFIDALFQRDPDAKIGWYGSRDNFINVTTDEYNRCKTYRPDLNRTAPWLAHN